MENLKPEDIKQIRLYLHQLMSKQERAAFEERILENPEFAAEVEVQRIAQMYEFTKIKDHLKDLKSQMLAQGELLEEKRELPLREIPLTRSREVKPEHKEVKVISFWPKLLAAAAVILGLVSIGVWYYQTDKSTDQQLSEKKEPKIQPVNPSAQDMLNGLISEARQPREGVPQTLQKAVGAFENEDQDQAIKLLQAKKQQLAQQKDSDEYGAGSETSSIKQDPVLESYRQFYLGLSYLLKGEPQKALVYLGRVKAPLLREAQWYSALAYLKNNEPEKAKPILAAIEKTSDSVYGKEAALLLKELK